MALTPSPPAAGRRVTIVTAGQLSTCPRMLKAADALDEAGYDVRVISTRFIRWATDADTAVKDRRNWRWTVVDYAKWSQPSQALVTSLRWRLANARVRWQGAARVPWTTAIDAYARVHRELVAAAMAEPTDLYYGGTTGALAAVAEAAERTGRPYGLDLEDLHSAESMEADASRQHALAERLERRVLPGAAFVTVSNEPIGEVYRQRHQVDVTTIHNVVARPSAEPALTPEPGPLRLYWFGQTLGPGRALEDVIEAVIAADIDARVVLRGWPNPSYAFGLAKRVLERGARAQVTVEPPVDPDSVTATCAGFHIGISTEHPAVENRARCLSNKLLTYMAAGLAVIATDTPGQRVVARDLREGGLWYAPGDVAGLAEGLRRWDRDRQLLLAARRASWQAAVSRWHWEHPCERGALLARVASTI